MTTIDILSRCPKVKTTTYIIIFDSHGTQIFHLYAFNASKFTTRFILNAEIEKFHFGRKNKVLFVNLKAFYPVPERTPCTITEIFSACKNLQNDPLEYWVQVFDHRKKGLSLLGECPYTMMNPIHLDTIPSRFYFLTDKKIFYVEFKD